MKDAGNLLGREINTGIFSGVVLSSSAQINN